MAKPSTTRVNIRPGVGILSVLRHVGYQPWFALGEFVDNAIQSFLSHKRALQKLGGPSTRLTVRIDLSTSNGGRITIRDDAGGIATGDYARAFRAAEPPPDREGLSEFGMGMKNAAFWFASRWSVRTSALGEAVEGSVAFDLTAIVRHAIEEVPVHSRKVNADAHYTELTLVDLHKIPQTNTIAKIRTHLASIYRRYLMDGTLQLYFNDESLMYERPPILRAAHFDKPDGRAKKWSKKIDIRLSTGKRVRGFAALRETGSTGEAGFALFRHGRLVFGSADAAYRPSYIFGKSTSFAYQRLFGELDLEGFDVPHTKDGFRWEDEEEEILELLRTAIDAKPLPLLQQARHYRSKPRREDVAKAAGVALDRTAAALEREGSLVLSALHVAALDGQPPRRLAVRPTTVERVIELDYQSVRWRVRLEMTDDPTPTNWLEVSDQQTTVGSRKDPVHELTVRFALSHPFTTRFVRPDDEEQLEPLLRIAAGLALAETIARAGGAKYAGAVRVHFNDILRDALSKP